MAHAIQSTTGKPPGRLARFIIAALAAVALVSGVLNIRPLLDGSATAFAPVGPSAVDALVGAPERPLTRLDSSISALQDALRGGEERTKGPAATMLGQAYLQKARETGDPGTTRRLRRSSARRSMPTTPISKRPSGSAPWRWPAISSRKRLPGARRRVNSIPITPPPTASSATPRSSSAATTKRLKRCKR